MDRKKKIGVSRPLYNKWYKEIKKRRYQNISRRAGRKKNGRDY